MSGAPTLSALTGTWSLSRDITHAHGALHRFRGEARFSQSGPRLIEDQTGTLTDGQGTAPLIATRRYVWTMEVGRLEVFFGDMRPFHTIPIGAATPETTYLCPPDRYHVSYDFRAFPDWVAVWDVEGPKKNYRMESRYSR